MKLLEHFKRMQAKAAEYIADHRTPGYSLDRDFSLTMVEMLDGPEQREAQAEASFDYIAEAKLTMSGSYHGHKVTMAELRGRIAHAIASGNMLDQVKRALFYGTGDGIGLTNSIGARNANEAPFLISGVEIPLVNASLTEAEKAQVKQAEILLHCALGKFTEAAEFLENIFKAMNGEAPPDFVNLREEIGDGLWYDANALDALGSDFTTEKRRNIAKLRERFAERFIEYDAQNRDLERERIVLEGDPVGDALAAMSPEDRALVLAETQNLSDPVLRERFASRCPACGLANSQHRPNCPNVPSL